jgi:hypothetical protein
MRIPVPLLVASAQVAAAAAHAQDRMEASPLVAPFSSTRHGEPPPHGWMPFSLGGGEWQALSRNVFEDFRRACGVEPGMLTDVGVLTDTEDTGVAAEAFSAR